MSVEIYPLLPLLIVDDESSWIRTLSMTIKRQAGINNVLECTDSMKVMDLLAEQEVSAIVLDLMMPQKTGEQLLPEIVENYPEIPVIILSGMNQMEAAVRCIRIGAYDYFVKGAEVDRMIAGLERALDFRALQSKNRTLTKSFLADDLQHPEVFVSTITQSEKMKAVFRYVESIAGSYEPLLITGASGTGKELIAKSYHRLCCVTGPWVPLNIASVEDEELATTLFGQVSGGKSIAGMASRAQGGVLFLDEIGAMTPKAQVKLLRLIREGEYTPVGGDKALRFEGRIVCATNADLVAKVARGEFRKDLYYKLSTNHVRLPDLKERKEDLLLLVGYFNEEICRQLGKEKPTVPQELALLLSTYHFPGNVQELKAMMFSALANHQARILSLNRFKEAIGWKQEDLFDSTVSTSTETAVSTDQLVIPENMPTLAEASRLLVAEAMRRAEGNQSIACGMLGITRQALGQRLKKSKQDS